MPRKSKISPIPFGAVSAKCECGWGVSFVSDSRDDALTTGLQLLTYEVMNHETDKHPERNAEFRAEFANVWGHEFGEES